VEKSTSIRISLGKEKSTITFDASGHTYHKVLASLGEETVQLAGVSLHKVNGMFHLEFNRDITPLRWSRKEVTKDAKNVEVVKYFGKVVSPEYDEWGDLLENWLNSLPPDMLKNCYVSTKKLGKSARSAKDNDAPETEIQVR